MSNRPTRARRGLSILEAVMALVFLSGATLTVVGLFHTGLRRQAHADDRIQAASLAQRHLEELRHNALNTAGYEALSSLDGSYAPDPGQPQFQVAMVSREANLISPCTAFGQVQNLGQVEPVRILTGAARWVWVGVLWEGAGSSLRLAGLVSEPVRLLDDPPKVQVLTPSAPPDPVPHDGQVQMQATLLDVRGQAIEGPRFKFFIKPQTASATLHPYRDGRHVNVTNRLALPNASSPTYDSGPLVLTASGRYFGQSVVGHSAPLNLAP